MFTDKNGLELLLVFLKLSNKDKMGVQNNQVKQLVLEIVHNLLGYSFAAQSFISKELTTDVYFPISDFIKFLRVFLRPSDQQEQVPQQKETQQ